MGLLPEQVQHVQILQSLRLWSPPGPSESSPQILKLKKISKVLLLLPRLSLNPSTIKLVYNDHPMGLKIVSLLTSGRCSEVIYAMKGQFGTSKWWSLWTGVCYSRLVVSSILTVYTMLWWYFTFWNFLFRNFLKFCLLLNPCHFQVSIVLLSQLAEVSNKLKERSRK